MTSSPPPSPTLLSSSSSSSSSLKSLELEALSTDPTPLLSVAAKSTSSPSDVEVVAPGSTDAPSTPSSLSLLSSHAAAVPVATQAKIPEETAAVETITVETTAISTPAETTVPAETAKEAETATVPTATVETEETPTEATKPAETSTAITTAMATETIATAEGTATEVDPVVDPSTSSLSTFISSSSSVATAQASSTPGNINPSKYLPLSNSAAILSISTSPVEEPANITIIITDEDSDSDTKNLIINESRGSFKDSVSRETPPTPEVRRQESVASDFFRRDSLKRARFHSVCGPIRRADLEFLESLHRESLREDQEEQSLEDTDESKCKLFRSMTAEQVLTIVTCCICNFTLAAFYGLIAPFFPDAAEQKGASPLAVGFIFGIFQATFGIFSPIFGTYISTFGPRLLFTGGLIVSGTSAILFGLLDMSPNGPIFVTLCMIIRFTGALGAAGFDTAVCITVAYVYPNNVAMMFGLLELFTGLGFMVGPALGGALYQLGGYGLPFFSLGAGVTVIGIFSIFLLPNHIVHMPKREGSVWELILLPEVVIVGFCLMCGTAALGFLEVTLSTFLHKTYHLSVVLVGLMFLVYSALYAVSAPVWGYLLDKYSQCSLHLVVMGFTIGGLSFIFMGPAPFLHIPHMLWLQVTCSAVFGVGLGTIVLTYPIFTEAAVSSGYPDNLATYGLTAGIYNTGFSIGACIGPLVGGFLEERISFEAAAAYVGASVLLSASILLAYICFQNKENCFRGVKVDEERSRRQSYISISSEATDSSERKLLLSPRLYALHRRKTIE